MADVARLLPRHWDGRRLLRFLAGLALLVLAFAAPTGLTGGPAPAGAAVTTTVDLPVAAPPTGAGHATATTASADVAAPPVAPAPVVAVPGTVAAAGSPVRPATVVPAGAHPGVHGSRGPPLA